MMFKLQLVLLLMVALLTGCGQVIVFGHVIGEKPVAAAVKTDSPTTNPVAVTAGMQVVKAVMLVLSPQAVTQVANDSRFNEPALLEAIKAELRSRQLLDDNAAQASTANISIDDFSVQPTSNAVVFGYIPSVGKLNGDIHVSDADGHDLQTFRVEADARFSIPASGADTNPLKALYRRFAVLAGDNLAHTSSKSESRTDSLPR